MVGLGNVALVGIVAIAIRCALLHLTENGWIDEFGWVDAQQSPSTWLDVVWLAVRIRDADTPPLAVQPWLQYCSTVPICAEWMLLRGRLVLGILDGCTSAIVAWTLPESSPRWLMWAHAVNPISLISCTLGSSAALDYFLLTCVVASYGGSMIALLVACAASVAALGSAWAAVLFLPVALIAKRCHHHKGVCGGGTNRWSVILTICCGMTAVAAAVSVLDERHTDYGPATIPNFPPDVGSTWYVWTLIPPVFGVPYAVIMKFAPVALVAPMALIDVEADEQTSVRRFLAVWCVCVTCVSLPTTTIPLLAMCVCFVVVSTYDVFLQMKHHFAPVVGTCMVLPLQRAFLRGWVETRVFNANWLFFACVFQLTALSIFLLNYASAFLKLCDARNTGPSLHPGTDGKGEDHEATLVVPSDEGRVTGSA